MNRRVGQGAQKIVPVSLKGLRRPRQSQQPVEILAVPLPRLPADQQAFLAALRIRQGRQDGVDTEKPMALLVSLGLG